MARGNYDLIVIGSGSGGLGAALGMLELGFEVLLVDKSAEDIGGECVNTGCVPSKALLHVAKQIHQAKLSSRFGLQANGEIDIEKIKDYIREKQDSVRERENVDYFRKKGMEVVLGTAAFLSKNEILVNNKIFYAKNIVIATGSSPRKIEIKGAGRISVFTNESVFDIDFIPKNFIFIGAGPVSVELGQAFSRLGSKVSFIETGDRILKKEDAEIANVLLKKLRQEEIDFYFNSQISEIRNGDTAIVKNESGEARKIPVDAVFMGLGREIDFDSLNLGRAKIETKEGKIVLNKRLQTTNKNVFVSGDAADNFKFSHAAELHNMLLISNFISPVKKKLDLDHFPWVTFTDPEIATFGLNEKTLKERKVAFEKLETDFSEDDRAVTDDYEYGKLILFIEKKRLHAGNAKILGGSMIAPNAGEITQELVLANTTGIKLKDLMNKIYAYPTAGNVHKILARKRITKQLKPWMKRAIVNWYRWKE